MDDLIFTGYPRWKPQNILIGSPRCKDSHNGKSSNCWMHLESRSTIDLGLRDFSYCWLYQAVSTISLQAKTCPNWFSMACHSHHHFCWSNWLHWTIDENPGFPKELYLYAVGFLYLSLCFLIALGMDQDDGTADSENNPPFGPSAGPWGCNADDCSPSWGVKSTCLLKKSWQRTVDGRNHAPPKGWLKAYKSCDKQPIHWCRISSIHCMVAC
jgi:hypothetical protein